MIEHGQEARDERSLTPCGNSVCTGCRVCGCPALGIAPQEARDDELEALIAEARREAGRWGPGPTATGMLINRLADALARKHSEPEQGSCWDEAPSVRVPPGECAPMPMLCELRAGHLGAHRAGTRQWMRGRKHPETEITEVRPIEQVYVRRGGVYLLDEHAGVMIDSAGNFVAKTRSEPRAMAAMLRLIAADIEEGTQRLAREWEGEWPVPRVPVEEGEQP